MKKTTVKFIHFWFSYNFAIEIKILAQSHFFAPGVIGEKLKKTVVPKNFQNGVVLNLSPLFALKSFKLKRIYYSYPDKKVVFWSQENKNSIDVMILPTIITTISCVVRLFNFFEVETAEFDVEYLFENLGRSISCTSSSEA